MTAWALGQPAGGLPLLLRLLGEQWTAGRTDRTQTSPDTESDNAPAADGAVQGRRSAAPGRESSGRQPPGRESLEPDSDDQLRAKASWAIVERIQDGDAEAFGELYDRYADQVFRYLYFRLGSREAAEDLTGDTFLRALRRIGSLSWQGRDVGAWLTTIARNLVADHYKSSRYKLEISTADMLDADRPDRHAETHPEEQTLSLLASEQVLRAVRRLGPEQQECIVLRFLQGLSVAETAEVLGKSTNAVKALQYRAVRSLAALLPEGVTL